MGVRRNFSRGGNVDISLTLFQFANDTMQIDHHKMLFTLSTPQRKYPKKARAPFAFFAIVLRWSCMWVCEKVVLFLILYSFCWIRVSSNIIIIVNCRKRTLNWTWTIHNYVYGAHIGLCKLNPTTQNFILNLFYTLAIRNCFSFHNPRNIHFSKTFQK